MKAMRIGFPRSVSLGVLAVLLVAGGIALSVSTVRLSLLKSIGSILVVSDSLSTADVIVITVDGGAAGVLDAADLFKNHVAKRVALFADPPDAVDLEFLRRGISYEDRAAQLTRLLGLLGVENVEQIPRPANGTEAEGEVLPDWCDSQQLSSVVVITTSDHARRIRRVLHRAMNGRATKVMIRPTPYSPFDPNRWWETRGGTRTAIVELEKLLLDYVRHPVP